MLCLTSTPFYT
uniref:Uncharacterized protein n=1 Tax=Arundo donax TaxID=35708 RepID=A0A0A8YIZ7_ARUDO